MADPRTTLETVIQTAIDSALKEVHTMLPAVVKSFDPVTQTVEAQPTIQRKISGELVDLPLLIGVPIRYMKSAKYSISFPIEIGDHVWISFAERSIDTWLLSGDIQAPGDIRKHSLSDAFAIPMMYAQTEVIQDFDPVNLQIKTVSGHGITLTPAGVIELNGNSDFAVAFNDLKQAFDTFVTDFNAHIHTTTATVALSPVGVISPPVTPTAADMAGAKIDTIKVP